MPSRLATIFVGFVDELRKGLLSKALFEAEIIESIGSGLLLLIVGLSE